MTEYERGYAAANEEIKVFGSPPVTFDQQEGEARCRAFAAWSRELRRKCPNESRDYLDGYALRVAEHCGVADLLINRFVKDGE